MPHPPSLGSTVELQTCTQGRAPAPGHRSRLRGPRRDPFHRRRRHRRHHLRHGRTINRAVPVAQADGPHAALELLAPLEHDDRLARYQPLHAGKAELLRRAGDLDGARAAYRRAIALTDNTRERAALERRAATLTGPARP
jgi:hypothetical protein